MIGLSNGAMPLSEGAMRFRIQDFNTGWIEITGTLMSVQTGSNARPSSETRTGGGVLVAVGTKGAETLSISCTPTQDETVNTAADWYKDFIRRAYQEKCAPIIEIQLQKKTDCSDGDYFLSNSKGMATIGRTYVTNAPSMHDVNFESGGVVTKTFEVMTESLNDDYTFTA